MSDKKGVVSVSSKHIEAGIKKYKGEPDPHLNAVIQNAGFNYSSFVFNDGRILLVLPNNIGGVLYPNQDILFEILDLRR